MPHRPVFRRLISRTAPCGAGIAGVLVLATGLTSTAAAVPLSVNPIVVAVHRGDCNEAVKLVKQQVASNNALSTFLAGRMLNEGICVQKDRLAAADLLARAADLGDRSAALDYAAMVGLGEVGQQSYERSGTLCRAAGIDPGAHLSPYSLGYACTVRALASEMLRMTLPKGAFHPNSGALLVAFSPASAHLQVRSSPQVGIGDAPTGSNMRAPLIDPAQEVEKAWRAAAAAVPAPEASRLEEQTVELALDVDMTLEVGHDPATDKSRIPYGTLLQGELRRAGSQ